MIGFCICGLGLPYLLVQVPLMLWWRWKASRVRKAEWHALPRTLQSEDVLPDRETSSSAPADEGDGEAATQEPLCHVVSRCTGAEMDGGVSAWLPPVWHRLDFGSGRHRARAPPPPPKPHPAERRLPPNPWASTDARRAHIRRTSGDNG